MHEGGRGPLGRVGRHGIRAIRRTEVNIWRQLTTVSYCFSSFQVVERTVQQLKLITIVWVGRQKRLGVSSSDQLCEVAKCSLPATSIVLGSSSLSRGISMKALV